MRVLIVDDDVIVADVIRDSMDWKKLGISEVQSVYHVHNAKQILLQYPVDIVISDIEMPMESGLDLLKWYREKNMTGKFLMLTSHENFQYATEALRYHAEEYLMKPFNVEVMEIVLKKIIKDLKEERKKEGGRLNRENDRDFWSKLFAGRMINTEEGIIWELEKRGLLIDRKMKCRLVVSRVTNMEADIEMYGHGMSLFMVENLHAELLNGSPESESVIWFEQPREAVYVTVCQELDAGRIRQKCNDLIWKCGEILNATVTCCISEPCGITDFYDTYRRETEILMRDIVHYGESFFEYEAMNERKEGHPILELDQMEKYLEEKNKTAFMVYLKCELDMRKQMHILDNGMMKSLRQEIQQAVYVQLANRGIQVSLLLSDAVSMEISEKAERSAVDMIRWVNYLLEKVFAYEAEIQKTQTIIDKIHEYIYEHYKEKIGRNEIGAHFYLVPEYLAKMYKKKTGKNLKDTINEYRLEQAKILLNDLQIRVSDVAAEVGFDNFSYFSTLFKKYTGMTPNEYRKSTYF